MLARSFYHLSSCSLAMEDSNDCCVVDTNKIFLLNVIAHLIRASGNGMAGTAMAVPVFEGEKWHRLDSNLTCIIECPLRVLRHSLGRLRNLHKSSSIQSSDERIRPLKFLWR